MPRKRAATEEARPDWLSVGSRGHRRAIDASSTEAVVEMRLAVGRMALLTASARPTRYLDRARHDIGSMRRMTRQ
jgi:hypothetical protein